MGEAAMAEDIGTGEAATVGGTGVGGPELFFGWIESK